MAWTAFRRRRCRRRRDRSPGWAAGRESAGRALSRPCRAATRRGRLRRCWPRCRIAAPPRPWAKWTKHCVPSASWLRQRDALDRDRRRHCRRRRAARSGCSRPFTSFGTGMRSAARRTASAVASAGVAYSAIQIAEQRRRSRSAGCGSLTYITCVRRSMTTFSSVSGRSTMPSPLLYGPHQVRARLRGTGRRGCSPAAPCGGSASRRS